MVIPGTISGNKTSFPCPTRVSRAIEPSVLVSVRSGLTIEDSHFSGVELVDGPDDVELSGLVGL